MAKNIYEFLCFLERTPATWDNILLYKHGTGKEYFHFCQQAGLVKEVGESVRKEPRYGLTDMAEKLLRTGKLNQFLELMEKEGENS